LEHLSKAQKEHERKSFVQCDASKQVLVPYIPAAWSVSFLYFL